GKMKIGKGLIAIRVGHTVKEEGEYKGQKYTTIRHWATLTFEPRILQLEPDRERESPVSAPAAERKENTEATKLLAGARAARANWEGFTGFTADLEVNVEGKVTRGKIDVDHKGKVTLEGIEDKTLEGWTRRQMASIVGHRLDSGSDQKTPCAFADDDAHHPLGRAIQVLNDESHS